MVKSLDSRCESFLFIIQKLCISFSGVTLYTGVYVPMCQLYCVMAVVLTVCIGASSMVSGETGELICNNMILLA